MKLLKKINGKHTGLFAAGLLLGTAGVKVLSTKDAKNVYTKCTAAVLRAKESVMKTVTTVQENAGDIYAEAQQINEDRKAQETSYADESQTEDAGNVKEDNGNDDLTKEDQTEESDKVDNSSDKSDNQN